MSLSGKTAIITGSTSGIGLGIAKSLAAKGANVVLNGLGDATDNADAIKEVEAICPNVMFHPANMMNPDEIADLVAQAKAKFGSVDILVNNAGIQHVAPIDEFPEGKWDAIIAINLTSAFHTIRHALPHMKENGWGRIINIASAHSLVASAYKSAYVAAKHGIAGMTKTVALEVATQGITVNAVSPGYVLTPLVEGQLADTAKARDMSEAEVKDKVMLAGQPTKEFVSIENVAELTAYLCSDAAKGITGTNMSIDGGWTAQ
ncbi:MAG: 3-hydroxybutyrate dehydrogenase [Pseudomonadota bacterium]